MSESNRGSAASGGSEPAPVAAGHPAPSATSSPAAAPADDRPLTVDDVRRWCHDVVFAPGSGEPTLGIELEWLTRRGDGGRLDLADVEQLVELVEPLPSGSRATIEPGGQLELSTPPLPTVDEACSTAANDLYVLDNASAAHGIELVALGADPEREPERIVTASRYATMQAYFDDRSDAGRTMMCNTAALQVNVGHGGPDRIVERWRLAHIIGPALIASFANSPLAGGRSTGWQSTRLRSWWAIDPTRSAPVPVHGDPGEQWLEYALAAPVIAVRDDDGECCPPPCTMTFAEWLRGVGPRRATLADLTYHLTTLFPPVRPRGWLELRMFDALPTPFWQVAVAVSTSLLDGDDGDEVARAVAGTEDLWVDAAQLGLGHPALASAAQRCFELAIARLDSGPTDQGVVDLVRGYHDRMVARRRSPADDRLDAWRRDGTLWPRRESPVHYADELVDARVLP